MLLVRLLPPPCTCTYLPFAHRCAQRWLSNKGRDRRSRGKSKKISQSSVKWLARQSKDQYVKRARDEGSPSRAVYKLEQIDKSALRGRLFKKGDSVVELGAAPGGWSLYASEQIGPKGRLVAVDLLPLDARAMTELETAESGADFYFAQGDFNSLQVKEYIADALRIEDEDTGGDSDNQVEALIRYRADIILSDMAGNFTGDQRTDALKTMSLCENALMFAAGSTCFTTSDANNKDMKVLLQISSNTPWQTIGLLRAGGSFLCKFFQCGKENERELIDAARRLFTDTKVIKPPASRKESAERYLLATGFRGTPSLVPVGT